MTSFNPRFKTILNNSSNEGSFAFHHTPQLVATNMLPIVTPMFSAVIKVSWFVTTCFQLVPSVTIEIWSCEKYHLIGSLRKTKILEIPHTIT